MAGDWIKIEHATCDKAEVLRIADLLGMDRLRALGLLVNFWVWLDRNMSNANGVTKVTHMSRKSIDEVMTSGFAACLIDVGWAKMDDETGILTIINGERHNGNPAKSRALGKDRAASHRVTLSSRKSNAGSVTREEKRRVLVLPSVVETPTTDARATADNNAFLKGGKPKPETKTAGRWDATEAGIDAKGRELGIPPKPGLDYFQYARVLWAAINERSRNSTN